MSAPTKITTAVLGTYASFSSVAHGGTPVNSTSFDMRTFFDSCFIWKVLNGTSPTVAVTIQPQVSDDNSHWSNDGGALVVGLTSATEFNGTYEPPVSAMYARLQFVNADTSVDATATAYAMATTTVV
jgi:hypothetical protein